jgi:son of sevenless-like protein
MSSVEGPVKVVRVEIPFVQTSDMRQIVCKIPQHIPVPPTSKLYDTSIAVPLDANIENEDQKVLEQKLASFQAGQSYKRIDKNQWTALAMKRNPEILALMERGRMLTKKASFGKHEFKNGFNADFICTTESRDALTREQLIQLLFQHFQSKQLKHTAKALAEETGIKYNGVYQNSIYGSVLTNLVCMGVHDESRIRELPEGTQSLDIEKDTEVQTASIYTHLDTEYDPSDIRAKVWDSFREMQEDDIDYQKKEGPKAVLGATLNRLIELLLIDTEQVDAKIMETFLLTYRSFTTPEILLYKLMETYQTPRDPPRSNISSDSWETQVKYIQASIGKTLSKWLSMFFRLDFNQNMIRQLINFIDDYISKDNPTMAAYLINTIIEDVKGTKEEIKSTQVEEKKIALPIVPKNIFSDTLMLGDIDELEIARQLTLMEHTLYTSIKPIELLNNAWSNPKLKHRAVNVLKSSLRFNQISKWIVSFILKPESLRVRKTNWIKGLKLAGHLLKLNNFDSLLAVSSGLQNAAVHRLKWTQEGTDPKLFQDFDFIVNLMSSDKAFRTYRNYLQNVQPPLVPYIGIYLTDLTFVEDGNKDYIPHATTERKLINWAKRKMVYEFISKIQEYQVKTYEIAPVFQIQQVIEAALSEPFLSEKENYEVSKKREPMECQKGDLIQ